MVAVRAADIVADDRHQEHAAGGVRGPRLLIGRRERSCRRNRGALPQIGRLEIVRGLEADRTRRWRGWRRRRWWWWRWWRRGRRVDQKGALGPKAGTPPKRQRPEPRA